MKVSEKICRTTVISTACLMSAFALFCIYSRADSLLHAGGLRSIATGLSMYGSSSSYASTKPTAAAPEKSTSSKSTDTESSTIKKRPDISDHRGEQTYLVTESLFRESNMSYDNFYVKNSTDLSLDIGRYLRAPLPFEYEEMTEPQVLIVHTHATESYMDYDLGYYYESFYPRDTDDNYNVVRVGKAICDSLQQNGIASVHCVTHHDDPQYYGAYDNSAESINEYLSKYPSIKVVLDIHRDSITTDDNEKIKPTFTYNNKKAAQIMIMCGNDNNGYYDFPDWEQNLSLALKLHKNAETLYPGMTRPLYFGNFMYNMNLAPGSLLIEVGTDANTLEEAVNSGEMLGNVIAETLKNSASPQAD